MHFVKTCSLVCLCVPHMARANQGLVGWAAKHRHIQELKSCHTESYPTSYWFDLLLGSLGFSIDTVTISWEILGEFVVFEFLLIFTDSVYQQYWREAVFQVQMRSAAARPTMGTVPPSTVARQGRHAINVVATAMSVAMRSLASEPGWRRHRPSFKAGNMMELQKWVAWGTKHVKAPGFASPINCSFLTWAVKSTFPTMQR